MIHDHELNQAMRNFDPSFASQIVPLLSAAPPKPAVARHNALDHTLVVFAFLGMHSIGQHVAFRYTFQDEAQVALAAVVHRSRALVHSQLLLPAAEFRQGIPGVQVILIEFVFFLMTVNANVVQPPSEFLVVRVPLQSLPKPTAHSRARMEENYPLGIGYQRNLPSSQAVRHQCGRLAR